MSRRDILDTMTIISPVDKPFFRLVGFPPHSREARIARVDFQAEMIREAIDSQRRGVAQRKRTALGTRGSPVRSRPPRPGAITILNPRTTPLTALLRRARPVRYDWLEDQARLETRRDVLMEYQRIGVLVTVSTLIADGMRQATYYQSPSLTIKATARFRPRKGRRNTDIILTIGKPNFRERAAIKKAKAEGKTFPFSDYRAWPEKKRRKAA